MYGMTNSGKLFADELTEWLFEAGFIQTQFQMSIYSRGVVVDLECLETIGYQQPP